MTDLYTSMCPQILGEMGMFILKSIAIYSAPIWTGRAVLKDLKLDPHMSAHVNCILGVIGRWLSMVTLWRPGSHP